MRLALMTTRPFLDLWPRDLGGVKAKQSCVCDVLQPKDDLHGNSCPAFQLFIAHTEANPATETLAFCKGFMMEQWRARRGPQARNLMRLKDGLLLGGPGSARGPIRPYAWAADHKTAAQIQ